MHDDFLTEFLESEFARVDLTRDARLGQRTGMRRVAIVQEGEVEERVRKDCTPYFLGSPLT